MIPKHSPRSLAAIWLTLALALAAMAGPAMTLAATPNWTAPPVTSLPTAVTPGAQAGYLLSITNPGPSNISQLFLVTTGGAPAPSYTDPSQGSCPNTGGQLLCSLGSLRKGKTATVVVAFPTPETGTSFSVNFEWNTTGLGSGGGDSSHGDALPRTGITELNADSDFAGSFLVNPTQIFNDQAVSSSNKHSTLVIPKEPKVAVTVEDGEGVTQLDCEGCFGETSEIQVGNGGPFGTGAFTIIIRMDASDLIPGVNSNNLDFYHVYPTGPTTTATEIITDSCNFVGQNPTPKNIPCLTVTNLGGGDLQAVIWTNFNGVLRGI